MDDREKTEPTNLRATLKKILHEVESKSENSPAEILRAWDEVVEKKIRAHATPHRLHKNVLFLSIDTSIWLYEIETKYKKNILIALQKKLGKHVVKKIVLNVGT